MFAYLYTKSVELCQNGSQTGREWKCDDVKEHYELAKFVDRVLDRLVDDHSEPQSIELRHIIEESSKKAHELADLSLHRLIRYIHLDFIIGETQVFDVKFLEKRVNFVCWLKGQNDQEKATHVSPKEIINDSDYNSYLEVGLAI